VAAHVVVHKLVDHLPLYRQARIFERQRVDLSESTLGDLFTQVANKLSQVYEVHRQEMLASGYLNVDERRSPHRHNQKIIMKAINDDTSTGQR